VSTTTFTNLLAAIDLSYVDLKPYKWVFIADVCITLTDTRQLTIMLYETYDRVGAFRVDRTYYRGATDEDFWRFISMCQNTAPIGSKGK
jgi:hypothetical protein